MKRSRRQSIPTNDGTTPSLIPNPDSPKQAAKRFVVTRSPISSKKALGPTNEKRTSSRQTLKETSVNSFKSGPLSTLPKSKQQSLRALQHSKGLDDQLQRLRDEMSVKEEDSARKLKEKERIIDLLVRDLKIATAKHSQSEKERLAQSKSLEEAKEKNEDLEQKLKTKVDAIELLENELKTTKSELALAEESTSKAISEHNLTMDQLHSYIETWSEASQKLTKSQIEIENLKTNYSSIKEEMETANRTHILEMKTTESHFKKQISELEDKIANHEVNAKVITEEGELLKKQLAKSESEVFALKTQLKKEVKSRQDLEQNWVTLQSNVTIATSEEAENLLREKIVSLEASISVLEGKLRDAEVWNEDHERKAFENQSKLKARIKVLSEENVNLEREVLALDRRNRELVDLIDIDKCPERISEITHIFNLLNQDITTLELDRIKKRHRYILWEYKKWRENLLRKSINLKMLEDRIAQSKAQLAKVKKLKEVPDPEPVLRALSETPPVPDLEEEEELVPLKRPRYFNVPKNGGNEMLPHNENGDTVVCDACKGTDPPIQSQDNSQEEMVQWVGCECERWFHKKCLNLTPEEFKIFSCDLIKKDCLDGVVTLE